MRAGTLALTGGAIILYWAGALPAWYLFLLPLPLLLLYGLLGCGARLPLMASAAVLIGLSWIAASIAEHEPTLAPDGSKPTTATAIGYPCSLIDYSSDGTRRVTFCVSEWPDAALPAPARLRLRLPDSLEGQPVAGPIRATIELRPAVGALNAGGGGYERWLFRQGLDGQGRALSLSPEADPSCSLQCRYHRLRQQLRERLLEHLPRLREPALVEALTLGSRVGLTEAHWDTLQATGTNHLVAISGLHVGLIAALIGWPASRLLLALGHRNANLARWLPLGVVAGVCGAYALLAGFTVPTRRALVMVLVAGFVLTSGRQWRLWDAWLIALVLVLLVDPVAPLDMGFWLSFGAVACLILCFGARLEQPGAMKALLLAQVAVVAGLWPLLSALGRDASLWALPSNLFAIPALSIILMPVLLVAAPLALLSPTTAAWVEPGLDLVFTLFWWVLGWMANHAIMMPAVPLFIIVPVTLLLFFVLMPVSNTFRVLVLITIPAVLLAQGAVSSNREAPAQLRVADGLDGVVLVRDQDKVLVFDPRPPSPGNRDRLRRIGRPWLEALGITRIDQLVVSHPGVHPQHSWSVVTSFVEVKEVISDHPEGWSGLTTTRCRTGTTMAVGDLRAELWRDPRVPELSTRESACTLRLRSAEAEALLFGPIGRSGERRLLQWLDNPASAALVVMPRQGRAGSSQQGMIELLDPDWAIAAAPAHGQKAPDPSVLNLYENQGAEVRVTGRTGEVVVDLQEEITVHTAREKAPFWLRSREWFEP